MRATKQEEKWMSVKLEGHENRGSSGQEKPREKEVPRGSGFHSEKKNRMWMKHTRQVYRSDWTRDNMNKNTWYIFMIYNTWYMWYEGTTYKDNVKDIK